jgi:eukaryotic-like serine/threonine-protein kinase
MTFTSGVQFDHYEVLSPLGAGGMGEVWRARDTRLNREVAIKILPASVANNADRLRRFKQEALATSALNHPNILTVYDIGDHAASPYIVTELLDGEELRAQLNGEPLPLRKAQDYAQQITQGLAAAHDKGIVHRDLKPENLFVTKDGRVKILDFGLAKLKPQQVGASDSQAPTQKKITDPGVVMGTVGYMSPEQVRGQETDHRSDIFALGVILYEMLSGHRPFTGDSAADVMSAMLKEEPPALSESGIKIAPGLEKVVRRCLEKKPEHRFHSAHDLGFALEALSTFSSSLPDSQLETATVLPAAPERAGIWRLLGNARLAWFAAGLFLLVGLPFVLAYLRRSPADERVFTFPVPPPEKTSLSIVWGPPAISPDGRFLAFVASTAENKRLLWVRKLDSLTARPLAGTDESIQPFWSPDSRTIGFYAAGKLKKIDVSGGPTETVCDVADVFRGAAWNEEGVILFAPGRAGHLFRVSASGGEPAPVTRIDSSRLENSHRHPCFLPDGRHFLYYVRSGRPENTGVYVGSLDGGETKQLLSGNTNGIYAPPGYLLFVREGTLMAQAFDANQRRLTGQAFPVAENVGAATPFSPANFTVSMSGELAYWSSAIEWRLEWFDRAGRQVGSVPSPGLPASMSISPDRKRVAVAILKTEMGNTDISLLEVSRGAFTLFISNPQSDNSPVWAPDGSRIAWASSREGGRNLDTLYEKATSGEGEEKLLHKSTEGKFITDWSRDGRFIAYESAYPTTNRDVWILPMEGEPKPYPILDSKFNEGEAHFSSDGKWIAYVSDESGVPEIYVLNFPTKGGKLPISTSGGRQPRFTRDGHELIYLANDGQMMSVKIKGATFGTPTQLFTIHTPMRGVSLFRYTPVYDVTADGQKFLIATPVEEVTTTPINVIMNWTAGLKR